MKIRVGGVLVLMAVMLVQSSAGEGPGVRELCRDYIEAWKGFYPSRACTAGFLEKIYDFEDYSEDSVCGWLAVNREALVRLDRMESGLELEDRIDARMLRKQILSEIDRWGGQAPHAHSPELYSRAISRAVREVVDSDLLDPGEKGRLILSRMEEINNLCFAGIRQLQTGSPRGIASSKEGLKGAAEYLTVRLPVMGGKGIAVDHLEGFEKKCQQTAAGINGLITHIEENVTPRPSRSDSPILGRETYAAGLRSTTESDLTPEGLEALAYEEINTVKRLMAATAGQYLEETYPGRPLPEDRDDIIRSALQDMEGSYPASQMEYLNLWKDLALKAEEFMRDRKIVTLPEYRTLSIVLAPESAGAMARIGWVSPAPPFHPNPWTTIYLPTIPDSFPEEEREPFWRSFNNYFTRFIVIHELFPGHYIQGKINRENPRMVRRLFPSALYSEGWATLTERVALDAGWDGGNLLTRLAQLRKRLENANRAYTSVKVHCSGWDQERVLEFSVGTSLVAPQFAKSLWGRLMRSPLQITTYFLGTRIFTSLLEAERQRQGDSFRIIEFMDTILRAGPIPLDEFPGIFERAFRIGR